MDRLEEWPTLIVFPYGKSYCKDCKHLGQWDLRGAIQEILISGHCAPDSIQADVRKVTWVKSYIYDISLFWWTSTLLGVSVWEISIAHIPRAVKQVPLPGNGVFFSPISHQSHTASSYLNFMRRYAFSSLFLWAWVI